MLRGIGQRIARQWETSKKKYTLAKQEIPADNIPARLERMDAFIKLLEDTAENKQEKSEQQKQQETFKEFDLHRISHAIHALEKELKSIKAKVQTGKESKEDKDKEKNQIHELQDKHYFLRAIREIALINREDELRLLTVFFDKGVREREVFNKETKAKVLLLGKATLLKYVRDKYLNLADTIMDEQNYAQNKLKLKEKFNELLVEQATVVHHKRYSITDQVRNKAGFTIAGLAAGSVVPGLGTAIGGLLGFMADRVISFTTDWNGGVSVTQRHYQAMATTVFGDKAGSKLAHELHAAHKAERVVHFDLPQAQLAAGPVMTTPAPSASATAAPTEVAPLIAPLSHPEGSSMVTLAEDKVVGVVNDIYKSGVTMFHDYELHKRIEGYDAYRRHLATDMGQTADSLAQVRKPQKA